MQQWDAPLVTSRLAEAGRTLMALRVPGVWPAGIRSNMPDFVREACEAYGYTAADLPPVPPPRRKIGEMDQALSWILLIPADRVVFRRIVGARCLGRPNQDKPMFSWRKIAAMVGASHVAVQGWHEEAIEMIVARLNRPGFCFAAGDKVGPSPDLVALQVRRAMVRARRRDGGRVREPA